MKKKIQTKISRINKPRKLKQGTLLNVAKTFGKWQISDDYLLIESIKQLSCIYSVHKLTKFSIKFSLKELQERWFAILYDKSISKYILVNLFLFIDLF
jgi:microspherule protein 1